MFALDSKATISENLSSWFGFLKEKGKREKEKKKIVKLAKLCLPWSISKLVTKGKE